MKFVNGRTLVAALLGVALFGTTAMAQGTTYGAPTLTPMASRPSSVRLSVKAGEGGAPEGFAAQWMTRAAYDAAGWPAGDDLSLRQGDFTGTPVWIVQGNAGDFTLAPSQWQAIQLGELFDESGVKSVTDADVAELAASTEYAVRVYAIDGAGAVASPYSATVLVTTSAAATNCTFTLGYWKTHPGAWTVTNLTIGTVNYTAAQLQAILNEPANGNGLLILAHQLIAAKLNILNGADGSTVAATIANADAMIGALVPPPVGSDTLLPSDVSALATTLDNFNMGLIGPGHCGDTAAKPATWGTVKSTYRR
jgi:hypothetical protein